MASNENTSETESLSDPTDRGEIMDREFEALDQQHMEQTAIFFGNNNKKPKKDTKLPKQPEAQAPNQDMENAQNYQASKRPAWLRQPRPLAREERHTSLLQANSYQATTDPIRARWPQQKPQREENDLKKSLLGTKCLLQQEKKRRTTAEEARAFDKTKLKEAGEKLQEERSLRMQLEQKVERLEDVLHQFHDRVIKDLKLAKRLQAEQTALEQDVEMERKQQVESRKELEDLKRQLEEKTTSNLKLAFQLRAQEMAKQELQKTLDLLTQHMCEQTPETDAPQMVQEIPDMSQHPSNDRQETVKNILDTPVDIPEMSNDVQETSNNIPVTQRDIQETPKDVPEMENDVSEMANNIQETPSDLQEMSKVHETANDVQDTLNDIPEIPHVQQRSNEIQDTPNQIQETPNKIQETPNETRCFKKAPTPKHRRKYKDRK